MKVHIWRTALNYQTGPRLAQACCGAHLPEAIAWATLGSIEEATCQHCLKSFRDHHAWRAENSSRYAREATERLESLRRAKKKCAR